MRQNTTLVTLATTFLLGASGTAQAGPDWALIERGRALKAEQIARQTQAAPTEAHVTQVRLQNYGPRPKFVAVETLPREPSKLGQAPHAD